MTATLPDTRPQAPERAAPRLLLASRSPRRAELLRSGGFTHETTDSGVDDGQLLPGSTPAFAWVAALSYLKARAAWEKLSIDQRRGTVVLGADTVVHKQGRIIGQPVDEADARAILSTLENGAHEVLTGVTLLASTLPLNDLARLGFSIEPDCDASGAQRAALVDTAHVRVGIIGRERIEAYLDSGAWRGKAGAYNLSERLGEGWPITFEGDPGTIMGLPLRRLGPALHRLMEGTPA